MEELTWLNSQVHQKYPIEQKNLPADLIHSYQEKIALLNDEVRQLTEEVHQRDQELSQTKLNKQRSRSLEKVSNGTTDDGSRTRRGISVDGGENLREELNAAIEENRLFKSKIFKLEDQLNNFLVVSETKRSLLQVEHLPSGKGKSAAQIGRTIETNGRRNVERRSSDIHQEDRSVRDGTFVHHRSSLSDEMIHLIKENKSNETLSFDLQQTLHSSRWNKTVAFLIADHRDVVFTLICWRI